MTASDFHGQARKNDTHQSTTDPEAKLYRKADGREVLGRINDHKITDLADLLRWNWCRPVPVDRAA